MYRQHVRFNHDFEPVNKADADRIAEGSKRQNTLRSYVTCVQKAEVPWNHTASHSMRPVSFLRYPDNRHQLDTNRPPTGNT